MKKLVTLLAVLFILGWWFYNSPAIDGIHTKGELFMAMDGTVVLIRILVANLLWIATIFIIMWNITGAQQKRANASQRQNRTGNAPIYGLPQQNTNPGPLAQWPWLESIAQWIGFGIEELNDLRIELTPTVLALAMSFLVMAQLFHDLDAYGLRMWTPVIYLWVVSLFFVLLMLNLGFAGTVALLLPKKVGIPGTDIGFNTNLGSKIRGAVLGFFAAAADVWLLNFLVDTSGMNSGWYWAFLGSISAIAIWGGLARNSFRFRLWWAAHLLIGICFFLIMLYQSMTKQEFHIPTLTTTQFIIFVVVGGALAILFVAKVGGHENPDPNAGGASNPNPASATVAGAHAPTKHSHFRWGLLLGWATVFLLFIALPLWIAYKDAERLDPGKDHLAGPKHMAAQLGDAYLYVSDRARGRDHVTIPSLRKDTPAQYTANSATAAEYQNTAERTQQTMQQSAATEVGCAQRRVRWNRVADAYPGNHVLHFSDEAQEAVRPGQTVKVCVQFVEVAADDISKMFVQLGGNTNNSWFSNSGESQVWYQEIKVPSDIRSEGPNGGYIHIGTLDQSGFHKHAEIYIWISGNSEATDSVHN